MKVVRILFKIAFITVIVFMAGYFVLYQVNSDVPEIPATVEKNDSLPKLSLKNYVFHCETFGQQDNPMILMLHGGPGADYLYLMNLKELQDSFFVVFYDQRGCGLSQRTSDEYLVYDTAISDVKSIINYFKPKEKVNIVGHSWGGMLACGFTGKYPEMVEKMIIAEPGFLTPEMADQYFLLTNGMRPEFSLTALSHVTKSYFRSLHLKKPDNDAAKDYFFQQLMLTAYPGHPLDGYYCDKDMLKIEVPIWRAGASASQYMLESGFDKNGKLKISFAKNLDTIDIPVLILTGECNSIIGKEHQSKHLPLFKNVKLKEIKNCGHYMFNEQPEESIKLIREFLDTSRI